jgi:transposase
MTVPSKVPVTFMGCDVGKASIVAFDSRDGRTRTIPNTAEGLVAFAAGLDDTCLVVCEATGGYEATLLRAMMTAGIPAHRADARKVKAFIRSFGTLGKTDGIDARALARYGQERQARLIRWQAPDQYRDQLQALVLTRRDLVAERLACNNRLSAPGADIVMPYLSAIEVCLSTQIREIEAAIEDIIHTHAPLAAAAKTLRSVAGIGATTAAALIALMPRARAVEQAPSRRSRRPRAPSQPKRRERCLPTHKRRTTRGQTCPLHGRAIGDQAQRNPQSLLRKAHRERKKANRRTYRRHAKTNRDL